MKFEYRNLSKSLIYTLMPMLVACGGNSCNNADEKKEAQKQNSRVELHTPEMDSVLVRYNHQMDSVETLQNKLDAAAKAYKNIFDDCSKDYFSNADDIGNEDAANTFFLYLGSNMRMMADSAQHYDWNARYLKQNIGFYFKNPAMEEKRAKTVLDSIKLQYDRAGVAEQCYLNAWHMLLRGYDNAGEFSDTYRSRRLITDYSAQKLFQISDSLAYYRAEKERLSQEMQKTK